MMSGKPEHIHCVTGRLAEHVLRPVLTQLSERLDCAFTLEVLPISVAALMSTQWVGRHIHVPDSATRVLLPGYCGGELTPLEQNLGIPVERGPRDLRQLPEYFGLAKSCVLPTELQQHSIDIVAEINHAPRLPIATTVELALRLQADGADVIDVGCEPGDPWLEAGVCVKALRDAGCRVSIDSFHPREVELAARAGAELVLSVNSSNRQAARDWGCEVVAIPDSLQMLDSLDETIEYLELHNVPLRIDPVLEPIGLGFAASLWRYLDARRRYPELPMLMGIGNLTELTDVDSAGLNFLLLGFCQEVSIRSVLTTQVVNWARTSVRECAIARRLVYHAVFNRVPPKRLSSELVVLRDDRLRPFGAAQLDELASQIKDRNVRIFAEEGSVHALCDGRRWSNSDPFELFAKMLSESSAHLDASHAFYLGYEMCKAVTALQLSKEYRQDEALNWGHLTIPETSHRTRPDRHG